jgi:anti-anti-sigma factor
MMMMMMRSRLQPRNSTVTGQSREHPADTAAGQSLVVHAEQLLGGPTSLQVVGVIDRTTAPLLEERLRQEARACHDQPARLLLDLEQVTFLDRCGLDTLLRAHSWLAGTQCTLELTAPTASVIRLLDEANIHGASWTPSHHNGSRRRPEVS